MINKAETNTQQPAAATMHKLPFSDMQAWLDVWSYCHEHYVSNVHTATLITKPAGAPFAAVPVRWVSHNRKIVCSESCASVAASSIHCPHFNQDGVPENSNFEGVVFV